MRDANKVLYILSSSTADLTCRTHAASRSQFGNRPIPVLLGRTAFTSAGFPIRVSKPHNVLMRGWDLHVRRQRHVWRRPEWVPRQPCSAVAWDLFCCLRCSLQLVWPSSLPLGCVEQSPWLPQTG
jgi:hypothetical protein